MKLFTFLTSEGHPRVGASIDFQPASGKIHDISHLFPTMLDLIQAGPDGLTAVRDAMNQHAPAVDLSAVTLLAPVPEPRRNVFCVGWNYLKHFNEGKAFRGNKDVELPAYPTFFSKSTRTVVGPGATVPFDSSISEQMDYEAEVAIIIGREGVNISASDAFQYIFGYTLANDISARTLQKRHGGQWLKGKSLDGTCPLGPAIITSDEIASVEDLTIRCRVNGELRQNATLRQLIFPIAQLIEHLSEGMTLLPGDIFLTGTPDGVGMGHNPPVFLRPGDEMVIESDQLGALSNVVGPDRRANSPGN